MTVTPALAVTHGATAVPSSASGSQAANGQDARAVAGLEHAAWIDDQIVDFVEAYLRLEHSDSYQTRNLVVDPVCGMVINKNLAAARYDRLGQPYYFCVEECQKKFLEDPERYLAVAKAKRAAKRGCHAEDNCTNA